MDERLTETCAECGGQGTIHETWDCGAGVDSRCVFCNGTGQVPLQMLATSPTLTDKLNEALVTVFERKIAEATKRMKEQIEEQIFSPSPLLKKYEGIKDVLYRQEIQGDDGPAVQPG